ncbi:MAG: nucleotide exchange factor GrpE [Patescibacteria group bacterium]|nr:nucleotide exchange factor GrpE [Patescibacteria group bacterium]
MSEEKKDKKEIQPDGGEKKDKYKHKDKYKNKYLRALADYQNLLKQAEKEKQEFVKYANANLIIEILPVLNNFKMAVKYIPEDQKDSQWIQGITHIQNQLLSVLSANGIEEIKTVGEKFDPEAHEAVENDVDKKEKEKYKKGIIIKEAIPGYKMHEKVIIPAKVIVNL